MNDLLSHPVLILGEHDKGFRVPFSRQTVSGRRLRDMLNDIGGAYKLDNVFLFNGKSTKPKDLPLVCEPYKTIIALGRVAKAECDRQGVKAMYLPHPAARSKNQLDKLKSGLAGLLQSSRGAGDSESPVFRCEGIDRQIFCHICGDAEYPFPNER